MARFCLFSFVSSSRNLVFVLLPNPFVIPMSPISTANSPPSSSTVWPHAYEAVAFSTASISFLNVSRITLRFNFCVAVTRP